MTGNKRNLTHHVIIPAVMPVIFFVVALTPVEVMGCRNRGLAALLIAFISGGAALSTAIIGIKKRARGDADTGWWVASTLILTIPVIALIVLA